MGEICGVYRKCMMTSSNGNIFRVTGLCAGNSPVPVNSPHKGQWRGAFDVFFDLRLNKRLSKQTWGWWFETLSSSLWRQCFEKIYHVKWIALHCYTAPSTRRIRRYDRITNEPWNCDIQSTWWTILSIGPLGTQFSEIWSWIIMQTFW